MGGIKNIQQQQLLLINKKVKIESNPERQKNVLERTL